MAKKPRKPATNKTPPQATSPTNADAPATNAGAPTTLNPYKILADIARNPNASSVARTNAAKTLIRAAGLKAKAAVAEPPIVARAVAILAERIAKPGAVATSGDHRGVALHAGQSETRLELVRREIDHAFATIDVDALAELAGDPVHSPESRLAAWALASARSEKATVSRSAQTVDQVALRASVAGLAETRWRDNTAYRSLLDTIGSERATPRETPIDEAELAEG